MPDLSLLVNLLQLAVMDRTQLALGNIALRYQLAVYKRSVKRPNINDGDHREAGTRRAASSVLAGRADAGRAPEASDVREKSAVNRRTASSRLLEYAPPGSWRS